MDSPKASSPVNHARPTRRSSASIDEYQIVSKVGEGAFGHVFKAMHKKTQVVRKRAASQGLMYRTQVVALKKIFTTEGSEDGVSFVTIRELKNLNLLKSCQRTVRLLDVLFAQGQLTMVLEFFEYDLAGLLLSRHNFTLPQVKCYLKQLLDAVAQIHLLGLMHRDIKPANVLINTRGHLKLADFGLMTTFGDDDESNKHNKRSHSTNVVTLWYRSPELLCGRTSYGPEVDMWSVGCILAEMILQRTPFPGNTDHNQLELIFAVCGSPTTEELPELVQLDFPIKKQPSTLGKLFKDLDPSGVEMLTRMLSLNSKARLTAKAAQDHAFFSTEPRACSPSELPSYPSIHEYEAKRKRQELKLEMEKRTKTEAPPAPTVPAKSASTMTADLAVPAVAAPRSAMANHPPSPLRSSAPAHPASVPPSLPPAPPQPVSPLAHPHRGDPHQQPPPPHALSSPPPPSLHQQYPHRGPPPPQDYRRNDVHHYDDWGPYYHPTPTGPPSMPVHAPPHPPPHAYQRSPPHYYYPPPPPHYYQPPPPPPPPRSSNYDRYVPSPPQPHYEHMDTYRPNNNVSSASSSRRHDRDDRPAYDSRRSRDSHWDDDSRYHRDARDRRQPYRR